jgi:dTMP kinase
MIPNPYSGILGAVDGINGSGKTTQVQLLEKWLREQYPTPMLHSLTAGRVIEVFKEPNKDGEYGKRIYEELFKGPDGLAMKDPVGFQSWYARDSKTNLEERVIPRLRNGGIVLLDRFRSALVHGAKSVADIDMLMMMNRMIIGEHFIWPDVLFIIDTPVEAAMERLKEKGRELDSQEQRSEQERTAEYFLVFAKKYPNCVVIKDDGTAASMKTKHEAIKSHMQKLLEAKPARGV